MSISESEVKAKCPYAGTNKCDFFEHQQSSKRFMDTHRDDKVEFEPILEEHPRPEGARGLVPRGRRRLTRFDFRKTRSTQNGDTLWWETRFELSNDVKRYNEGWIETNLTDASKLSFRQARQGASMRTRKHTYCPFRP